LFVRLRRASYQSVQLLAIQLLAVQVLTDPSMRQAPLSFLHPGSAQQLAACPTPAG
jgi:hypothetical protein